MVSGNQVSAGAAYAVPRVRAPRRAARRTAFSFKSPPSDDLPSWVTRSAQQGVDPSGGYSQMMRRAEQLGPQKLPSQVTRRAATARAVLPSGARPAFRQSKWKAGISRHPAHTGSDGPAEPSPLSKPAGPSRLPLPLLPAALVRRENGRRQGAGARLRWRPGRRACPRDFLITATNGSVTLRVQVRACQRDAAGNSRGWRHLRSSHARGKTHAQIAHRSDLRHGYWHCCRGRSGTSKCRLRRLRRRRGYSRRRRRRRYYWQRHRE